MTTKLHSVFNSTKPQANPTLSTTAPTLVAPTLTIMPTSSSSRFLILASLAIGGSGSLGFNSKALLRNGTAVHVGTSVSSRIATTATEAYAVSLGASQPWPLVILDSPASAAQVSYNIQCLTNGTSRVAYQNVDGQASTTNSNAYGISQSRMFAFEINETDGGNIKGLQTQEQTTTSSVSVPNVTWTDTGITLTITPTSSSSYLWLTGMLSMCASSAAANMLFRWDRDGSSILIGDAASTRIRCSVSSGGSATYFNLPINYMVAAGSTSPTTIKLQCYQGGGGTMTLYLGRDATDTDSTSFQRACQQFNIIEVLPS